MKDELKSILSSLPKRTLVSLVIIALTAIVAMTGYIGRDWYKDWHEQERKQQIQQDSLNRLFYDNLNGIKETITGRFDDVDEKQEKLYKELKKIDTKVNVISKEQSEVTQRILDQIDSDFSYEYPRVMPDLQAQESKKKL